VKLLRRASDGACATIIALSEKQLARLETQSSATEMFLTDIVSLFFCVGIQLLRLCIDVVCGDIILLCGHDLVQHINAIIGVLNMVVCTASEVGVSTRGKTKLLPIVFNTFFTTFVNECCTNAAGFASVRFRRLCRRIRLDPSVLFIFPCNVVDLHWYWVCLRFTSHSAAEITVCCPTHTEEVKDRNEIASEYAEQIEKFKTYVFVFSLLTVRVSRHLMASAMPLSPLLVFFATYASCEVEPTGV